MVEGEIFDDDDDGKVVGRRRELGGGSWSVYGESNTKIRRLEWLLKLCKNLDDSKPSEVGREDWTRRIRFLRVIDDDDDDEVAG